jgi:DNA-directed RNA polymerase subunit RPC12/RpoP
MTSFKCPGAVNIIQPKPEYVKCPNCGREIELWSDEFRGECKSCGKKVFKEESPSCIEWCRYAKECVGEDKYGEYMKNKKKE